jgi:hypothetical protein
MMDIHTNLSYREINMFYSITIISIIIYFIMHQGGTDCLYSPCFSNICTFPFPKMDVFKLLFHFIHMYDINIIMHTYTYIYIYIQREIKVNVVKKKKECSHV